MLKRFVRPYKSDGTQPDIDPLTGLCTLASSSTYYYEVTPKGTLMSVQFAWDSAIILTSLALEDSNLPGDICTPYATTAGYWLLENPSTAYIPVAGAGVSVTAATVAATGGAAGGCLYNIDGAGTARQRFKVVVAGTGGAVRCFVYGKE